MASEILWLIPAAIGPRPRMGPPLVARYRHQRPRRGAYQQQNKRQGAQE
ncbi:hypothetical protein HanLR1_Chr06g0217171 [Helianthus annuus]|nr:hypothetical protein HanHA89_Chr06g0233241 [Helianthus annuus]KAJ0738341.1 hypothetical protein HanLR1_Chr06g0217171 [Helianthus annuus]